MGSTTFYALSAGLGAAWAGMLVFFFISRSGTDKNKRQSRQAARKARRHLSKAKKALNQANNEDFYQALSAALWGYFADKFTIPQSRLSKEVINDELTKRQLDEAVIQEVMASMNRAEMARYNAAGTQDPADDYERAAQLLTQIEKRL
ncbi:MAG: hypothetical protein U5L96_00590 [Owenweeksia sp.]|nr:hypothetical protein [Owenweeksia sp.]